MYLNELKTEQKELFLDLSVNLAMSDNNFSYVEKNLIKQLCREMNINEKYNTDKSFDDIINNLSEICNEREKRIIIIELAGIVMIDNQYSEDEKKLIEDIVSTFDIDYKEFETLLKVINELYAVYKKMGDFLQKKLI